MTVHLLHEMVRFLDQVVADGEAASCDAVVSAAVEREMRRRMAERDTKILSQRGE